MGFDFPLWQISEPAKQASLQASLVDSFSRKAPPTRQSLSADRPFNRGKAHSVAEFRGAEGVTGDAHASARSGQHLRDFRDYDVYLLFA